MATRAKQHDAHVRARRKIEKRVFDRFLEWDAGSTRRIRGWRKVGWEEYYTAVRAAVARAVGAYRWRPDTWTCHGKYYYDRPQASWPAKDVTNHEIHGVMCTVRQHVPEAPT